MADKVEPKRARKTRREAPKAPAPDVTMTMALRLPAKALPEASASESGKAVTAGAVTGTAVTDDAVSDEAVTDEAIPDEAVADEGSSAAIDARNGTAARRAANRNAQRAESQAAFVTRQRDIADARRKALSTSTGIAAVALLGLIAYGLGTGDSAILASAALPLLLIVCLLCWRRERPLTRTEYLSLPHTQGRNGRLRCIHCSTLGMGLAEVQALQARRHACRKCGELLFSS